MPLWLRQAGVQRIDVCPRLHRLPPGALVVPSKDGGPPGSAGGTHRPDLNRETAMKSVYYPFCWRRRVLCRCPAATGARSRRSLRHPLPNTISRATAPSRIPVSPPSVCPICRGRHGDPITCADGAQQTLVRCCMRVCTRWVPTFLPRPCLAESASYDAESYALTVTVRSGVTFSDGSALTAWDVVAALRRAKESVRYGQRLAEMDFVSYLGESTLRIYLTRNDPQVRRPAGHSYHQGRHSGGHGTGGRRPLPLCQGRERGVSGPANGLVAG